MLQLMQFPKYVLFDNLHVWFNRQAIHGYDEQDSPLWNVWTVDQDFSTKLSSSE